MNTGKVKDRKMKQEVLGKENKLNLEKKVDNK